jgi:hypothetical protein
MTRNDMQYLLAGWTMSFQKALNHTHTPTDLTKHILLPLVIQEGHTRLGLDGDEST